MILICFTYLFLQTSTERLMYKPVNVIDLTASQLVDKSSIDRTVEELEDVLERRLTTPEIEVNYVQL